MEKVLLGSLIERMTRGVLIKAGELEKLTSYEKTNNEYLKICNVDNGLITGDMQYLTKIEERYQKYCLTNHCLVITKTGFSPKILVPEIEEGRNILASGNFFIIELNTSKVDPFYLASLFNSDKGKLMFMDVMVGNALPTINITKLKSLEIELPSFEEQKRIGDIYKDTISKIKDLKEQLNKEVDKLSHIL